MPHHECPKCSQSLDALTFRCQHCLGLMHVHHKRLPDIPEGALISLDCPECKANNIIKKPAYPIAKGYGVTPVQAEMEMPV